jgi:hypothetical protein
MPNVDPLINQYENDQRITTITTTAEKATNSKFEIISYLLRLNAKKI